VKLEDAEEYTQALGQVVAGGWRQIALGARLGVPDALGLSTRDWVHQRLGGYVRLSLPERREAVAELTEEGMSSRQIGEVLGVGKGTVHRDLSGAPSGASEPELEPEPQVVPAVEPDPAPDGAPEPEPPQAWEPEPQEPDEEPEPMEPPEVVTEALKNAPSVAAAALLAQHARAWSAFMSGLFQLDLAAVADVLSVEDRETYLGSLATMRRWADEYEAALRRNSLKVVQRA
jgi:hypothetical protein